MKLKSIIILAAILVSTAGFSQEKLKAFYVGYDKEYSTYTFEAVDGSTTEFVKVDPAVLKEYDLKSTKLIDKAFSIIYTVKTTGDDEDETDEYTITSLKPTALVRIENEDDEDDEE